MTVDYADVLRQAVANERFRIMRELRLAIEKVSTTERESHSYSSYATKDRRASDYKRDVLATIDRLEENQ